MNWPETPTNAATQHLLAVDLGLHTGLALFGHDGRLKRYSSQHFGNRAHLKRAVLALLHEMPALSDLIVEGDRAMGEVWAKAAMRVGAVTRFVSAETWRPSLLLPREQHSGADAKSHALLLARQVITWSNAKAPTSLNDDAAEAILIGLWGVLQLGWLSALPAELRRR